MSNLAVVALARVIKDAANADAIAENWKMSSIDRRQLAWTVDHRSEIMTIERLKYLVTIEGVDRDWIYDLCRMRDMYDTLRIIQEWTTPDFPITGNDIIAAGYTPGPQVGQALKRLRDMWAIGGYKMDRNELLTHI